MDLEFDADSLDGILRRRVAYGFDSGTYLSRMTRLAHFMQYGDERIHMTYLRVDGKEHPF